MVRRSVFVGLGLAAVSVVSANAAPLMLPGWPVAVSGGSVHQGPGGAVVVIGESPDSDRGAVLAFRRNGTLLWVNTRSFDSGNCEPPVRNPSQLQSNRTDPSACATFEVRQVVADVSGNAYASYDAGADGNGIAATRRVVALDKATGAFRWRQLDVTALAPLVSGVVVGDGHQVIAFAADGHELWRAATTGAS